jgi:hypothetical protein
MIGIIQYSSIILVMPLRTKEQYGILCLLYKERNSRDDYVWLGVVIDHNSNATSQKSGSLNNVS